jgi:MoxR-like ATPase
MKDWKIFLGDGSQHDNLLDLPDPPPWRFSRVAGKLIRPAAFELNQEDKRAAPFLPSKEMIIAVNAALYLRRPLLITGKPGTGKSTLIYKVAHELKLGPVLRWPINSRSTVRGGIYEYDAVGRLQAGKNKAPPVEQYLTLGPLGTALMAETWPRPLLIDEIDKSDLDFANDLLDVIEEGEYIIPELRRLPKKTGVRVNDFLGRPVTIAGGRIQCSHFPFVVLTSNAEREFPAPFLRRCVRLRVEPPQNLAGIIQSHLEHYSTKMNMKEVEAIISDFDLSRKANKDVSTDQLLNAVFLTVSMRAAHERSFSKDELAALRKSLMRELSGPSS